MKRLKSLPLVGSNKAVSYAVSALIVTGTTIGLVLVASVYAFQMLERQRGASEFEVTKKSILAFNDALENVAWEAGASRSTRFSVHYGYLQLVPNINSITINATVNGQSKPLSTPTFPGSTGLIRYWISNNYVAMGPSEVSYILGNSNPVISGSVESYGRAVIKQEQTGLIAITLDYRVRVMKTSVIRVMGVDVNYVDINVIKLSMIVSTPWSYVHDFDLTARCLSVQTSSSEYTVDNSQTSQVSVQIGTESAQVPIALVPGKVVFSIAVSNLQVKV